MVTRTDLTMVFQALQRKGRCLGASVNNEQCFCSQVPLRRARAKSLSSLKSAGKVLPQQASLGLDQADMKLNLHFSVHMLSPPGNSPHVEPPEEIICASGKNNPRRAAVPPGRLQCGWCACGGCCCRVEEPRGRAQLLGKVSPGESIKTPFFLNRAHSCKRYCELPRGIIWSCYRVVIDHAVSHHVTPVALRLQEYKRVTDGERCCFLHLFTGFVIVVAVMLSRETQYSEEAEDLCLYLVSPSPSKIRPC